jgi:hypothetical protein
MDSARAGAQRLQADFPADGFAPFAARLDAVRWMFDSAAGAVDVADVISRLERFAAPGLVQTATRASVRWTLQLMEQQPSAPNRAWPYSASRTGVPALDTIVAAARLAHDGRVREAIDLSNTIRGLEIAHLVPDPFFRTVLHLLMARWYTAIDNRQKAIEELRWHEAVDQAESPIDLPLVQEIDWAFGTLARWKRAQLLDGYGDTEGEICRSFRAVAEQWQSGLPPYKSRADTARQRMQALGCASS